MALRLGLQSAFRNPLTFGRFLTERLDRDVNSYAPISGSYDDMVFAVVDGANGEGWAAELAVKAVETVPGNPKLADAAEQLGFTVVTRQRLEQVTNQLNLFLDVQLTISKLNVLQHRVCRVEIPASQNKTIYGTGFLIGPDLLMTNYHVVEAVIKGEQNKTTAQGVSAKAADVRCRFDYKRLDNYDINEGTVYTFASQWLLDSSPFHPTDPNQLDYAVIRLKGTPGTDPISAAEGTIGDPRGFIAMPSYEYPFDKNSPVWILQHPDKLPMKLAIDTTGVVELKADRSRVTYTTNTEGGSSGSPCFNQLLEPIALHHSGDPNFPDMPKVNEGIPLSTIREAISNKSLSWQLP
jgi:hypothetical protein